MTGDLPKAQPTPDGTLTVFSERYGELYASRHGAGRQSRAVFLEGSATHLHPSPRVLEIGFGLGLNFRTTLKQVSGRGAALAYRAFEAYPLPASVLAEVSAGEAHPLWLALLDAWDAGVLRGELELGGGPHHLRIDFADVNAADLPKGWASAVYLDGFSPARNPEVWTPPLLARLAASLASGGVLATYSAAGAVRRGLIAAGLDVEKRRGQEHGLIGKREFLVARRA
ncbi:hypothetical protein DKM44_12080 [Deinococcus irradiatisoli]|uniref:MnmC-like methyltransferase domain-containing protein n=1 Tax=Deinococcus irradiatisoli TaxID=2202254 RepID=A0A2Z3JFD2_9DEIO|nr:tRNA (5-methylaminomethyl-2-thiouridine)(34)-methyltransferase MnmD [Deinococcus irradiatisoli]AWN23873.1 hypothetical protein DKM44_12080 [Deinococcus irradiatisoli]